MASAMDGQEVLNLTRQHLKKVEPAPGNVHHSSLLLDHNDINRLENVETYCSLTKLSASHNQLVRMYGVARLYSLRVLNLSHNAIVGIEGLKDLKYLTALNLAGNNVKSIEHLGANILLEVLDLTDNAVSSIPDLSHLSKLRKLHLATNKIKTLQFCERFLPTSLTSLTLAENGLTDLNEVSRISHLGLLDVFTISGNPCTDSNSQPDFYRPFVINWLPSLKIMDESPIGPRETLVAEWLFSLGRGRQFKIGQHDELVAYLLSVRPEVENNMEDGKILSLAQQHQQLAMAAAVAAVNVAAPSVPSPTPPRKAVPTPRKNPIPLRNHKGVSPPKEGNSTPRRRMEDAEALMCQSLDPSSAHLALERSTSAGTSNSGHLPRPQRPISASHEASMIPVEVKRSSSVNKGKPVKSATFSKLPVHKKSATITSQSAGQLKVNQETQAAIAIQKIWRGYQVRNLDPTVKQLKSQLRQSRTEEHISELNRHLSTDDDLRSKVVQLERQVLDLESSMRSVLDWIADAQPSRPTSLALANKSAPHSAPVLTTDDCSQLPVDVESYAQGMASRLIRQTVSGGASFDNE